MVALQSGIQILVAEIPREAKSPSRMGSDGKGQNLVSKVVGLGNELSDSLTMVERGSCVCHEDLPGRTKGLGLLKRGCSGHVDSSL